MSAPARPRIRVITLASLFAATLLLAAGCDPVMVKAPTASEPPKDSEGSVVLTITGNTARVNQFDTIKIKQYMKPEPGIARIGREYILSQVSKGLARDTALFIGAAPEGRYTVERFEDSDTRQFIDLTAKTSERIGLIEVKAGKVSDLGRLVVTALNTQVLIGRSERVRSNADLVKRFAPDSASVYEREVHEGWVGPRDASDRVEEYALQRPVGAAAMTEMADGSVVAASRLGTLLVRGKTGQWGKIRSDGLESLLWLKPYVTESSWLVAVGEFNTMLRLDRKGSLVRIDTGNLPAGNLIFIDGNDGAGWYVAAQHDKTVTLYRSDRLEAGDWQPQRSETIQESFWSGENRYWAWSTADGFAFAVSAGKIRSYSFASKDWKEYKAPKDNRLIAVAPQANGTIGILTSPGGGFGGVFATDYLSRDGGATWEEIKSPFKVKVSPPYVTRDGKLLLIGGAFGTPEIQESSDMGKTWRRINDKVTLGDEMISLPTNGLFLVSSGQQIGVATIKHSDDGGVTWTVEYSNFDRAAYDAQKKK